MPTSRNTTCPTSGTSTNTPTISSIGKKDSTIFPNCFSGQPPNKKIRLPPTKVRTAIAITTTADAHMKYLKQILILLTGGLTILNTFAAETSDRPLHVLYLGPVSSGGGGRGGGFGGPRTNYVYLPGQTLAPEAIYFDHRADVTNLTATYLKHFDAIVQAMPDADVAPTQ